MSTPLEDHAEGPRGHGRSFALGLRLLGGLSAAISLLALWSVERSRLPYDLQLAAEPRARPGETIALRAVLFRDVDEPSGPVLASAPVRVRLRDAAERELASVALAPSELATMDGRLRLPAGLLGAFTLEAESHYEGRRLSCRRALQIDPRASPVRPGGREAGPMQQFALGRVRSTSAEPAPDPLLARVVGGACIPEQPCRLLVWVGEPAAAVALRPAAEGAAAATPLSAPSPAGETSGLVALDLVVRGLDAQVTLQARRDGGLVAERTLRLPIGLGEVGISAPHSLLALGDAELSYLPLPGRDRWIVDVFAAGRWRASWATGAARARVPADALAYGVVRLQARVDRFSAESAGARVVYVRAPGESDTAALAQIARGAAGDGEPLGRPGDDPTAGWAQALPAFALADPQRAAAFLLAPLEQLRMPVPAPVSGRPRQLAQLARTRVLMRFGVAGALALSALVVALSIARRGLGAADQAEAILDEARAWELAPGRSGLREEGPDTAADEPEPDAAELLRNRAHARSIARARVLLLALAVASAFLAAALLIASKPLWF